MLDKITKNPIVILSVPRSGSTALGRYLEKNTGLSFFTEPEYLGTGEQFRDYAAQSNNYIIKFHYYDRQRYSYLLNYLINSSETFKISLRRRDIIKQAASHYIAHTKNDIRGFEMWHASTPERLKTLIDEVSVLPINADRIKELLILCKTRDDELSKSTVKFDLDLFFEDIIPLLEQSVIKEFPKPRNYSEILQATTEIYKNLY